MTQNMDQEQVVMTPKCKTANSTVLVIERKKVQATNNDKVHVAGGDHTGIVINKEVVAVNGEVQQPAQLSLEFRVFLVNSHTGKHTQESRTLRYWFRELPEKGELTNSENASVAQEFFRELVSPQEFPRDYVGFIKKIMKLMQHNYRTINKLELELKQLEATEVPNRPLSADESILGTVAILTTEKLLEIIESSYPNPVVISEIAKEHGWDEEEISACLAELQNRGLIKSMEHGAFTRQQSQDAQVTVVKQMPTIASAHQPTIAIITAQYCEKIAVDAMIENKETFVRYTTIGESNVYTLGNIGAHRVVCTKLPTVGHTREAMTAAGNTTTRLLGTFQKVEYIFLVGVGGGVPHYTDYNKHVRLGDVVVSYPIKDKVIYIYCNDAKKVDKVCEFDMKPYSSPSLNLQQIARNLKFSAESHSNENPPWLTYINHGLKSLNSTQEQDFNPPSKETDKLYMAIGEKDLIEVAHPEPLENTFRRQEGCPKIHLSPIAAGRQVVRDDQLRQQFASTVGALAFDCEYDAVIESILGNCKESFICVRGISDYRDGLRRKEWQPYSSLVAASVMKAIICGMEPPTL
ncbi:uncharacterized protein LOC108733669 [Agrilus planipennis]|uniref:Uncharacterized protein LOC108733669 n=1 Tax=Agrilus planipennis TaxID=224129 RepID=A0A7F5RGI4_AGRPL|nr:uncharacterized protein LOC108733669 [Agrilus planipennis]XP_025834976.1 uncharacterized protein LOC108733669 [Agrilus planipennis]